MSRQPEQNSDAPLDVDTLMETIPDGVLVVGSDGTILRANRRVEEIFQHTSEELVGEPVERLVPGALRERHERLRREYTEAPTERGMGEAMTFQGLRSDGTTIPVDIMLGYRRMEPCGEIQVVAVVRETSHLVEAQKQLHRQTARFAETQRLASVGYWSYLPETGEVDASSHVCRMFGQNPEDCDCGEDCPATDCPLADEGVLGTLAMCEKHQQATQLEWEAAEAHYRLKAEPSEEGGVEGIVRDVTREHDLERARTRAPRLVARLLKQYSQSTDLSTIVEQGLRETLQLSGADCAALLQVEGDRVAFRFGVGWSTDSPDSFPFRADTAVGRAQFADEAVRVEDFVTNPNLKRFSLLRQENIRSGLFAAVKGMADGLGILTILWREAGAPTDPQAALVEAVASTLTEIHERRRIQEAYQTSRHRYRSLFEESREAVFLSQPDGSFLSVNEAFAELFGYDQNELLSMNAVELYAEEQTRQKILKLLETQGALKEYEAQGVRADGSTFPGLLSIGARRDEDGEIVELQGLVRDISEQRELRQKLEERALYDQLTGLPNRYLFRDRLVQTLERVKRRGTGFAIGVVDLDNFKQVNDSFGHLVGDRLLKRVASRLDGEVRGEDTVARVGGDEFMLILEHVDSHEAMELVAERLAALFDRPFAIEGHSIHANASVGYAFPRLRDIVDESGEFALEGLLRAADRAMYRAKDRPETTWQVFDPVEEGARSQWLQRENRIREGLQNGEFVPHFQPIVDLRTGETVAAEVLARWDHPERGLLSAGTFIAVAERSGLIVDLSAQVWRAALEQVDAADPAALPARLERLYVNLSPRLIEQTDFVEQFECRLADAPTDRIDLYTEVTESELVDYPERIHSLRERGYPIVVDDFGTGFSSFERLRDLQADVLKIDMEFVQRVPEAGSDAAIVRTLLDLGERLGTDVVAEGVETDEQAECLVEMGCETAQGYYFGRPQSLDQLVDDSSQ